MPVSGTFGNLALALNGEMECFDVVGILEPNYSEGEGRANPHFLHLRPSICTLTHHYEL